MNFKNDFDLFVAGKTGAFKGIKLETNGIIVKNLQNVKILKPNNEISVLRWDDDNECNVIIGTVDQHVKVYDTEFKAYSTCIETKFGTGAIVGVSRCNGAIVTCSESGHMKMWKYRETEQTQIEVGGSVSCMKSVSKKPGVVATGGKQNDLKLWDLETKTKIFNARNVKKDMLELEVPIWVSDVQYIPDTEYQLATCTKYGQVRLYDTRAQRRPVLDVQLPNQSLNTLVTCSNNNHIVTGSCTGFILSVDIRGKGKVLHSYKGAVGSIRQIACNNNNPYIASVGLDRHLRIHHLETRKLLHQKYLKARLNAVIMRATFSKEKQSEAANSGEEEVECINLEDSDPEYDTLFDNMETVGDKDYCKRKKQKLS
ncbi:UNVERIFIED_CONTAM: hypothetical protein PYX00_006528 [Menopon gallinae]|uniref:WD repeat-containing protein 74 n=1 Tax=Menopon gallinae TaxID=328185 RepID=A0AAW2HVC5_9NEOP